MARVFTDADFADATPTPGPRVFSEQDFAPGEPAPSAWNLIDAAKQYGSGAIEGTLGLLGMAADLNPFVPKMPRYDPATKTIGTPGPLDFSMSQQLTQMADPILAEEDPNYRYSRTIGQFTGPGGALGLLGKAAKAAGATGKTASWLESFLAPRMAAQDAAAGLGAQGAEDVTGDSVIAPIIGAVGAGGLTSLLTDLGKGAGRWLEGASPERIKQTAADAFKAHTQLDPKQLEAALLKQSDDPLSLLRSTAELTDNAGAAQIELELSKTGKGAVDYNRRWMERAKTRDSMLDAMTPVAAVNREGLGASLQKAAGDTLERASIEEGNLWSGVPRHEPINVATVQADLTKSIKRRQAGLPPGSKVNTLISQIAPQEAGDAIRTSGALQDIRSSALGLLRDANLQPVEAELLGKITKGIDDAMAKGLKGDAYDVWKAAREATSGKQELFGRSSAGGSLVNEAVSPAKVLANAFKGDSVSAKQIKAAVNNSAPLLDEVKRGILDQVPRNAQNQLTPAGIKKFIVANEGGLKELFGESHLGTFKKVAEDLASQANVPQTAMRASTGNSITSQSTSVAGAVRNIVLNQIAPGSSVIAGILDEISAAGGNRVASRVDELLLKGAIDPKFALELTKSPTTARIVSTLTRVKEMVGNASSQAAKSTAIEIARPAEKKSSPPGAVARGGSSSKSSNLQNRPVVAEPSSTTDSRKRIKASPSPDFTSDPDISKPRNRAALSGYQNSSFIDRAMDRAEGVSMEDVKPVAPYTISVRSVKQETDLKDIIEKGLIPQESGGDPDAVSEKGAVGLGQLMPKTGEELAKKAGVKYTPKDPEQNKMLTTMYMQELLQEFDGDLELALTSYHSGPNRVKKLLAKNKATTLKEIKHDLGPVGQKYAAQILDRLRKSKVIYV